MWLEVKIIKITNKKFIVNIVILVFTYEQMVGHA